MSQVNPSRLYLDIIDKSVISFGLSKKDIPNKIWHTLQNAEYVLCPRDLQSKIYFITNRGKLRNRRILVTVRILDSIRGVGQYDYSIDTTLISLNFLQTDDLPEDRYTLPSGLLSDIYFAIHDAIKVFELNAGLNDDDVLVPDNVFGHTNSEGGILETDETKTE